MKRRESIKAIALGALATSGLAQACQPNDNKDGQSSAKTNEQAGGYLDRYAAELEHYKKVVANTFFDANEMVVITLLADIIIPADKVSGSASQSGVPAFIEFIAKDMPQHQNPVRGGIRWLDRHCLLRYSKSFADCDEKQRLEMVDEIAWPEKAKPGMEQGVAFFNLMRDLTATGFYTSEMGFKDLGYVGNRPNQWNGVPPEVLQQYGLAYSDKELKECINFDT
jgi:hypothetical protein